MNLDFPSRFLKKLEIYQQIRNNQGISKHKQLWKYEKAFLQTSYGKEHQYLSDFVSRPRFKEWIEKESPFKSKSDEEKLNKIIANLFWRGYIDVVYRKKDTKEGLELFDRNTKGYKSDVFKENENEKKFDYRATMEGLLVGEVLSEIDSKKIFLKYWNRYKYNWVLDTVWFLVFFGLLKLVLPSTTQQNVEKIKVNLFNITIDYVGIIMLVIFIIWPFLAFLYRKLYSMVED